ncbi:MAG: sulfatase [Rikenellaceae bacterium]
MTTNQVLLTLAAVAISPLCSEAVAKKSQPQNVLFILVDDLGWNDLSFMGSDYYESPNLDRLAASGVVFTDAYASCPVSSPSRASIMSGQYTTRHGVTDWIGEAEGENWRKQNRHSKLLPATYVWAIDHDLTLMPELLKENGYTTFIAGKWHLGEEETDWPEYHGFDINKGGYKSGSPKGGYFAPYDNPRLEDGPDGENLSMRLANETVSFIENHVKTKKKEPFFAYLSFYAVHGSIQTTEETWRYFRDKAERMGIAEQGFEVDRTLPVRLHQDNPVYAGLIKQMDDAVGRVIDALDKMGLDENTLIVFTSDNGGVVSGDSFSSSLAPLRGGKGRQFEGGIRVPLIVKSPKATAMNGEKCSVPVYGIDYYPTIMEYAGVKVPESVSLDGVDINPLLNGESIADRSLFWHYPHYGNQGGEPSSIIRKGDWKLIYYHEDLRCELYNLAIDLSENEHLNIQYPDKVKELKAELLAWLDETNARMPVADPIYDPVAESKVKYNWATKTLQQKENERKKMLSPEYKPNATWWGSNVTVD